MNNTKVLLTSEQKKINAKESKRKYYLKNKDKYKKWNADSGFKNVIDNTNDEKILIEYLLLVNQKLKQIHSTTSYSN